MPPSIYVFMGLIAGGKSTLARAFAQEHSLACFNSDVIRKELAGMSPDSRQGSELNRGIYTPEFSRLTYDGLLERARSELLHDRSVVLDGSYHKRDERQRVVECATSCKASLFFILCQCDEKETRRRLDIRAKNPNAVSDGTWAIYQRRKEFFEFPDELSPASLLVFDTKKSVSELLHALNQLLPS